MKESFTVRNAHPSEFDEIGKLMVDVYSQLDGFPKPHEQPNYYRLLSNVGEFVTKPETEILIAFSAEEKIAGAVVYFGDIKHYASGGTATQEQNTSGFRLLAVNPAARGQGVGRILVDECISKARTKKQKQVIIHTTMAMQTAWKMYEQIGFKRSEDLDFMQGDLKVFGFRLSIQGSE